MSEVKLFVYDLSQGVARQLSPALLGKQIDGIWHSALGVYGREYYFGGGICTDLPGQTPYGTPVHTHHLGTTSKSESDFLTFLSSIATRYTPAAYHLLDNNCNHFTDACAIFLVSQNIPAYVRDLPAQAMNSPLGPMLRPMVDSMQAAIVQQSDGHQLALPNSSSNTPTIPTTTPIHKPPTSTMPPTSPTSRIAALAASPVVLKSGNVTSIARKLSSFDPTLLPAQTTGTDSATIARLVKHARTAPPDQAFPSLDLLRLASASTSSAATTIASDLPFLLERHVPESNLHVPSATMALRLAINQHVHAIPKAHDLLDILGIALNSNASVPMRTAALLAQNIAGASRRNGKKCEEDVATRLLFIASDILSSSPSPPSLVAAPLLRAVALTVHDDPDAVSVLDAYGLDTDVFVDDEDEDVRTAARLMQAVRTPP